MSVEECLNGTDFYDRLWDNHKLLMTRRPTWAILFTIYSAILTLGCLGNGLVFAAILRTPYDCIFKCPLKMRLTDPFAPSPTCFVHL